MSSSSSPISDPVGVHPRAALLIDFGGVLTVPLQQAFQGLGADLGLDADDALGVLATHGGGGARSVSTRSVASRTRASRTPSRPR